MTPTLLAGRYELGPVLGRGGMAEVRRARDIRLGRDVAIKLLRVDLAGDATFQERFRREAQAAAGLNHPNIVSVYDTGKELDPDSGVEVPYIVMELVVGHTLREILRDGRHLLPERALELTKGVLEALDYSHRHGIIHRDIKPANVMLTSTGQVKVMDFGIARAVADTSASMTQTAAVIGTAQYLSPEQARGETVDNRSDIYAAGCLLYELLVGRPPFQGDSPVSVAYQHVREIPVPPSQLDPLITPDMDAITLKALAKDPDQRFQTAHEMADDIGRLLAGTAIVTQAAVPAAEPDAAATQVIGDTGPVTPLEAETPPPVKKKRGGVIALVSLLVVALIGGTAFAIWWNMREKEQPVAMVAVPLVTTMNQDNAEQALRDNKLVPKVIEQQGPDDTTVGTVVSQDPEKGVQVPQQSEVAITVNKGPDKVTIPTGLAGKDKNAVESQLTALGFTKVTLQPADSEQPTDVADRVVRTNPAEGATVAKTTPVTVYYATGKSTIPNVRLLDQATAISTLNGAGFKDVKIDTEVSPLDPGVVIRQTPTAGQSVDRSSEVRIVVAKAGPTPTPTPTPTPAPTTPSPAPATSTP